MPRSTNRALSIAVAAAALICVSPAIAQTFGDLQYSKSCVEGFVEAYDYAELEQNMGESYWDSRGALRLQSEDEELTLRVLNANGTSVCDNVADLRTSCNFPLSGGSTVTVKIDNTMRSTQTRYRLCAN